MPDFTYDGKAYYNPVEFVMDRVGGLWKMAILWRLRNESRRYSELKRSIEHISDKVLSSQLRELEKDGFIVREVFAEVPVRTEYSLSERGTKVLPLVEQIRNYGIELMKDFDIDAKFYTG